MFQSVFSNDLFSELQQLQQQMQRAFDAGAGTGIRGNAMAGYPMLNVGRTPQSVELYAFAPGLDPASIDVSLERGVLSIAAERKQRPAGTGRESHRAYQRAFRGPLPPRDQHAGRYRAGRCLGAIQGRRAACTPEAP